MQVVTVRGPLLAAEIRDDVPFVLVNGNNGAPLLVACEVSPGVVAFSKLGDDDFDEVLRMAGVTDLVISDTLRQIADLSQSWIGHGP